MKNEILYYDDPNADFLDGMENLMNDELLAIINLNQDDDEISIQIRDHATIILQQRIS